MSQRWSRLRSFCTLPFTDALFGLDRCLVPGVAGLVLAGVGLVVGWWLYVPLHELLHAWACLATGGTVDRLEIDAFYGGALLAGWFPWVVSGSEYAGRLAGFQTGGSDWVYLATDFGPYLLTLFPGAWLLRRAAATGASLLYGFSLPMALAPLVALIGDAYEIGSIVVTQLPPWSASHISGLLRGDDLFHRISALAEGGSVAAWAGLVLAAVIGVLWALATYNLADLVARVLGQPPVQPLERPE